MSLYDPNESYGEEDNVRVKDDTPTYGYCDRCDESTDADELSENGGICDSCLEDEEDGDE